MKILKSITKIFAVIILVILGMLLLSVLTVAVMFSRLDKTNGKIESSGQERTYLLFVPASYDPAMPTPLVISIHGYSEWPAHLMQISGGTNWQMNTVSLLFIRPGPVSRGTGKPTARWWTPAIRWRMSFLSPSCWVVPYLTGPRIFDLNLNNGFQSSSPAGFDHGLF